MEQKAEQLWGKVWDKGGILVWGKIWGSSKTWGETWGIKLWGKTWGWGKSWGGVHDVKHGVIYGV